MLRQREDSQSRGEALGSIWEDYFCAPIIRIKVENKGKLLKVPTMVHVHFNTMNWSLAFEVQRHNLSCVLADNSDQDSIYIFINLSKKRAFSEQSYLEKSRKCLSPEPGNFAGIFSGKIG